MSTDGHNISGVASATSSGLTELTSVQSVGEVDQHRGAALQRTLSSISDLLQDDNTAGIGDFIELKENVERLKKTLNILNYIRQIYGENTIVSLSWHRSCQQNV